MKTVLSMLLMAAAGVTPPALFAAFDDFTPKVVSTEHPEAEPYDADADAMSQVDAALARATLNSKHVILVLGANWCHDSKALAGWFDTPRFSGMLEPKYEIVYVDVGTPQTGNGRNQNIISRFKGMKQKNTPYVMLLSPEGKLLNKMDARSWRNAASRTEDEIFEYFAAFPHQKL